MSLDRYCTLGRSGLRVSRLALGSMTFGTEWGWGADQTLARELFDVYLERGGNFVDTADMYTNGTSETWLGGFVASAGVRDRVVIASKYSFNAEPGNPNTGGNHRKNLMRALEGSLRRLGTDYIDLYYVHIWDRMTPVDEVMRTMDDAVRAGKIRYVGLSDVPAWYAARAQTLAQWRGFEPVAALQIEYSLVERTPELEFADLAVELGMGLVPWSPLAMGLLSGKYKQSADGTFGEGRLQITANDPRPAYARFNDRNFAIVAALEKVAREVDKPMAQVAINWLAGRRGVSSIIVGATRTAQLRETLASLNFELPATAVAELDLATAPARPFPYHLFGDIQQARIHGGVEVASAPARYQQPTIVPATAS
jgi:aryl-alcohol dehydrogenase-like predicted oxidoreductase